MRPSLPNQSAKANTQSRKKIISIEDLFHEGDPYQTIQTGKIMAKAWARSLEPDRLEEELRNFMFRLVADYWQAVNLAEGSSFSLPKIANDFVVGTLDNAAAAVASAIGQSAAKLDTITASYQIGNVYTALLPESLRARNGVFYTPPALSSRLIKLASDAGVDWSVARVADPACGGGAFLAPICLKIAEVLRDNPPRDILKHIESHVTGFEIDAFAAWLTQVFTEVALLHLIKKSGYRLASLVQIGDSLKLPEPPDSQKFDLIIANPPYGKLKLTDEVKERFNGSLYGHPNYYGLFTHLSLELVKEQGIVALLTPTSFLSGEYFKNLRFYIRSVAHPSSIDFVSLRKGVFEDVLQETMLAIYKKAQLDKHELVVNQIATIGEDDLIAEFAGCFHLPANLSEPWILPRTPKQAMPVRAMRQMECRLKDWGYKVSTGPLVWNRHKKQLRAREGENSFPVVWAESITNDGRFTWKAEKKNHYPYFEFVDGDNWLITNKTCILLQRTTSKEQGKRLIAAAIPEGFMAAHKTVVVENHLNMLVPISDAPKVTPEILAVFLNSQAANEAFKAISGSVAVSAYELESFPLPDSKELSNLKTLVKKGVANDLLEIACHKIYKRYA